MSRFDKAEKGRQFDKNRERRAYEKRTGMFSAAFQEGSKLHTDVLKNNLNDRGVMSDKEYKLYLENKKKGKESIRYLGKRTTGSKRMPNNIAEMIDVVFDQAFGKWSLEQYIHLKFFKEWVIIVFRFFNGNSKQYYTLSSTFYKEFVSFFCKYFLEHYFKSMRNNMHTINTCRLKCYDLVSTKQGINNIISEFGPAFILNPIFKKINNSNSKNKYIEYDYWRMHMVPISQMFNAQQKFIERKYVGFSKYNNDNDIRILSPQVGIGKGWWSFYGNLKNGEGKKLTNIHNMKEHIEIKFKTDESFSKVKQEKYITKKQRQIDADLTADEEDRDLLHFASQYVYNNSTLKGTSFIKSYYKIFRTNFERFHELMVEREKEQNETIEIENSEIPTPQVSSIEEINVEEDEIQDTMLINLKKYASRINVTSATSNLVFGNSILNNNEDNLKIENFPKLNSQVKINTTSLKKGKFDKAVNKIIKHEKNKLKISSRKQKKGNNLKESQLGSSHGEITQEDDVLDDIINTFTMDKLICCECKNKTLLLTPEGVWCQECNGRIQIKFKKNTEDLNVRTIGNILHGFFHHVPQITIHQIQIPTHIIPTLYCFTHCLTNDTLECGSKQDAKNHYYLNFICLILIEQHDVHKCKYDNLNGLNGEYTNTDDHDNGLDEQYEEVFRIRRDIYRQEYINLDNINIDADTEADEYINFGFLDYISIPYFHLTDEEDEPYLQRYTFDMALEEFCINFRIMMQHVAHRFSSSFGIREYINNFYLRLPNFYEHTVAFNLWYSIQFFFIFSFVFGLYRFAPLLGVVVTYGTFSSQVFGCLVWSILFLNIHMLIFLFFQGLLSLLFTLYLTIISVFAGWSLVFITFITQVGLLTIINVIYSSPQRIWTFIWENYRIDLSIIRFIERIKEKYRTWVLLKRESEQRQRMFNLFPLQKFKYHISFISSQFLFWAFNMTQFSIKILEFKILFSLYWSAFYLILTLQYKFLFSHNLILTYFTVCLISAIYDLHRNGELELAKARYPQLARIMFGFGGGQKMINNKIINQGKGSSSKTREIISAKPEDVSNAKKVIEKDKKEDLRIKRCNNYLKPYKCKWGEKCFYRHIEKRLLCNIVNCSDSNCLFSHDPNWCLDRDDKMILSDDESKEISINYETLSGGTGDVEEEEYNDIFICSEFPNLNTIFTNEEVILEKYTLYDCLGSPYCGLTAIDIACLTKPDENVYKELANGDLDSVACVDFIIKYAWSKGKNLAIIYEEENDDAIESEGKETQKKLVLEKYPNSQNFDWIILHLYEDKEDSYNNHYYLCCSDKTDMLISEFDTLENLIKLKKIDENRGIELTKTSYSFYDKILSLIFCFQSSYILTKEYRDLDNIDRRETAHKRDKFEVRDTYSNLKKYTILNLIYNKYLIDETVIMVILIDWFEVLTKGYQFYLKHFSLVNKVLNVNIEFDTLRLITYPHYLFSNKEELEENLELYKEFLTNSGEDADVENDFDSFHDSVKNNVSTIITLTEFQKLVYSLDYKGIINNINEFEKDDVCWFQQKCLLVFTSIISNLNDCLFFEYYERNMTISVQRFKRCFLEYQVGGKPEMIESCLSLIKQTKYINTNTSIPLIYKDTYDFSKDIITSNYIIKNVLETKVNRVCCNSPSFNSTMADVINIKNNQEAALDKLAYGEKPTTNFIENSSIENIIINKPIGFLPAIGFSNSGVQLGPGDYPVTDDLSVLIAIGGRSMNKDHHISLDKDLSDFREFGLKMNEIFLKECDFSDIVEQDPRDAMRRLYKGKKTRKYIDSKINDYSNYLKSDYNKKYVRNSCFVKFENSYKLIDNKPMVKPRAIMVMSDRSLMEYIQILDVIDRWNEGPIKKFQIKHESTQEIVRKIVEITSKEHIVTDYSSFECSIYGLIRTVENDIILKSLSKAGLNIAAKCFRRDFKNMRKLYYKKNVVNLCTRNSGDFHTSFMNGWLNFLVGAFIFLKENPGKNLSDFDMLAEGDDGLRKPNKDDIKEAQNLGFKFSTSVKGNNEGDVDFLKMRWVEGEKLLNIARALKVCWVLPNREINKNESLQLLRCSGLSLHYMSPGHPILYEIVNKIGKETAGKTIKRSILDSSLNPLNRYNNFLEGISKEQIIEDLKHFPIVNCKENLRSYVSEGALEFPSISLSSQFALEEQIRNSESNMLIDLCGLLDDYEIIKSYEKQTFQQVEYKNFNNEIIDFLNIIDCQIKNLQIIDKITRLNIMKLIFEG
jgi:hypothetical protein